jgi:hypothetical protein
MQEDRSSSFSPEAVEGQIIDPDPNSIRIPIRFDKELA